MELWNVTLIKLAVKQSALTRAAMRLRLLLAINSNQRNYSPEHESNVAAIAAG